MTTSPDQPLALVIDDDLRYVRQLRGDLASCACRTVVAGTGAQGLDLAALNQPDVVLLDLGLPDMHGLAALGGVRERVDAPVVAMTPAEDDAGIAGALEAGADDYLPKPFRVEQVLARLRAVLWRAPSARAGSPPPFASGDLRIDFAEAEVALDGEPVGMSASEYRLLRFLARNRDRVFRPAQLVGEVWGPEYLGDRHLARVYVGRVREKIERDPTAPRYLVTKPGEGYMLHRRA